MSEHQIKETMLTYVQESPSIIRRNVSCSDSLTESLVNEYISHNYRTIWIVASGSSANASNCARSFMRNYLKTEVKVITPFTFIHAEHDFTEDDFVFVVSQSGYSTNSIDALELIRSCGRKAIGITADLTSDIKDHADLLVDYGIGYESVGYVTKGVTGFVLYLMLFSIEAALKKGLMDPALAKQLKAEILDSASVHEKVQKQTEYFYKENFLHLTSMDKVYTCGVGAGFGIALEGAIKIGETVMVPSQALETEEYLHGPCLQIDPHLTVFMIDTGVAGKRTRDIYEANKLGTYHNFIITTNKDLMGDKQALVVDTDIRSDILPLCFLPFFQIISYHITNDTHRWPKYPAYDIFDKTVACKTENYVDRVEH